MAEQTTIENSNEKAEFVRIEFAKTQIDFAKPYVNDKGNEFVRIFAPDKQYFYYHSDSLKPVKDKEDRFYIVHPVGTELTLHRSNQVEGVLENKTISTKVTIEDLKDMYDTSRREYFAQRAAEEEEKKVYVNASVPTSWGKPFTGKDGNNYISISIPLEGKDGTRDYYSFVLPEQNFKSSTYSEGMSYFGFPKHLKDSDEDFMVVLKRSVKDENGEWQTEKREMRSVDLCKAIKTAKDYSNNASITIEVPEKLVHIFETKSETPQVLVDVRVPVFNEDLNRAEFYTIVIPDNRLRDSEHENKKEIIVSKTWEFKAVRSVKNEATDEYEKQYITLTGEEVSNCFKENAARFKAEQEEKEKTQSESQENVQQNRRGGGR